MSLLKHLMQTPNGGSAKNKIPNLFPQSEPAQISSTNLSCLTVWKTLHNQS